MTTGLWPAALAALLGRAGLLLQDHQRGLGLSSSSDGVAGGPWTSALLGGEHVLFYWLSTLLFLILGECLRSPLEAAEHISHVIPSGGPSLSPPASFHLLDSHSLLPSHRYLHDTHATMLPFRPLRAFSFLAAPWSQRPPSSQLEGFQLASIPAFGTGVRRSRARRLSASEAYPRYCCAPPLRVADRAIHAPCPWPVLGVG